MLVFYYLVSFVQHFGLLQLCLVGVHDGTRCTSPDHQHPHLHFLFQDCRTPEMPLPRYTIQPTHISRVHMPEKLDNELEYVSNETLCNLMHQMASVASVASEIFEELTTDLVTISARLNRIEERVSNVTTTLKSLPTSEEFLSVGLQHLTAPPSGVREQELDSQVLHRSTKPRCMQAQYEAAEPPPPLHVMDALRDDGKTTARLYSDPRFFFDLWRKEMLEDAFDGTGGPGGAKGGKKVVKKKRPKPKSKPSYTLGVIDYPPLQQQFLPKHEQKTLQSQSQQQLEQQETQPQQKPFPVTLPSSMPSEGSNVAASSEYGEPEETLTHPSEWIAGTARPTPPFPHYRGGSDGDLMASSCESPPPPPPPPPPLMDLSVSSLGGASGSGCGNTALSVEPIHNLPPYAPSLSPQLDGSGDALNVSADLLPPPPPPAVMTNSSDNLLSTSFHTDHPPPPPPPPPPPLPPSSSTTGKFPSKPVLPGPPRDLLSDIRAGGFQLRKVSERQLPPRADVKYSTTSRICDVSAIFEMVSRRRQCLENTSEDDDDKTSDSCGWED